LSGVKLGVELSAAVSGVQIVMEWCPLAGFSGSKATSTSSATKVIARGKCWSSQGRLFLRGSAVAARLRG